MGFPRILKKIGKIAGQGALSQVGIELGAQGLEVKSFTPEALAQVEEAVAQGVYRALIAAAQEDKGELAGE